MRCRRLGILYIQRFRRPFGDGSSGTASDVRRVEIRGSVMLTGYEVLMLISPVLTLVLSFLPIVEEVSRVTWVCRHVDYVSGGSLLPEL
jgi:hypothetical protein